MNPLKIFSFAALTAVVSSAAMAAPSSWDMPAGDHGTYTFSGGQTLNNKFGSGTAFSGGFFFVPTTFKAQAVAGLDRTPSISQGTTDTSSDTVSVILNAKSGSSFRSISSNILGDYSIFGAGGVSSLGTLRATNLDTHLTLSSPLAFGGTLPVTTTSDADGIFNGNSALALPDGWRNIRVDFDTSLSANTSNGSALIQVKDAELGVTTAEIPIPAALAVAPIAAFLGWRAKRKLMGAAR